MRLQAAFFFLGHVATRLADRFRGKEARSHEIRGELPLRVVAVEKLGLELHKNLAVALFEIEGARLEDFRPVWDGLKFAEEIENLWE